ncbi:MAG: hypothetical protein ACPGN3_07610 [Opitutales bacterium]
MTNTSPKLEWCHVRFGEDMNWWVYEISDNVHWDVDGLSILDPNQVKHVVELLEPLTDYGLKNEYFENAFFSFTIGKDLKDKCLEVSRVHDSILDNDEAIFALPDIMDEEKGPYADFLEHITRLRVKLLNDLIDFKQPFTIEELEEDVRESQNIDYMEGRAIHFFNEITAILEFVPEGFHLDADADDDDAVADPTRGVEAEELEEDFSDIEEAPDEDIEEDETMRWSEDEEEEESEEEDEITSPPDEPEEK